MSTYTIGSDPGDDYTSWANFNTAVPSPAAGSIISFRKGDTFREQVTVAASGSEGSPITYTAHGTGADPVICGSDLVGTWTASGGQSISYPAANDDDGVENNGGWASGYGAGPEYYLLAGQQTNDWNTHYRFVVTVPNAANITSSYFRATSQNAVSIKSGIQLKLSAEDVDDSVQINNVGEFNTAAAQLTTAKVDWDFNIASQDEQITSPDIKTIIQEVVDRGGWASGQHIQIFAHDDQATNFKDFRHHCYESSGASPELEVNYGYENVWQATLTSEPTSVFFNGTFGNKQTAIGDVDSEFDWFWDSNVLYVYSTSDPDSAYTSPGIEAMLRNYGIYASAKDYITIDGVQLIKSINSGIRSEDGENWVITNCTTDNNYYRGIFIDGNGGASVSGITINNNTIGATRDTNIGFHSAGILVRGVDSPLVYLNTISTENSVGIVFDDSSTVGTGNLTSSGSIYLNDISDCESGIILRYSGSNLVYRNYIHDGRGSGVGNAIESDGNKIYYNIIDTLDDSTDGVLYNGIDINNDAQNGEVYNNVIYKVHDFCITVEDDTAACDGWIIKNNIFDSSQNYGSKSCFYVGSGISTLTLSNNFYQYDTNLGSWKGSVKTSLSTWVAASSETNSQEGDPLMTDPANGDFTLQVGSPCRERGTNVALTADYDGSYVPQGLVDIGAYEYPGAGALFFGCNF